MTNCISEYCGCNLSFIAVNQGWWTSFRHKLCSAILAQFVERVAFNRVVVGLILTNGEYCGGIFIEVWITRRYWYGMENPKQKSLITAKIHSQSRSIDCWNYWCVINLFSPPYGCVFHSHYQRIWYYELSSNYDDTIRCI